MTKGPFRRRLAATGVLVLDGGFATELERRGVLLPPPLWSAAAILDYPDAVREVHRAYRDAGADILTTASYQVSVEGFRRAGRSREDARHALARSVALVRDVIREGEGEGERWPPPLVAGSLGSYGAVLADGSEYRGGFTQSVEGLRRFHAERAFPLAEAGPDLLVFETIPSIRELEALRRLVEDVAGVDMWIAVTLRDGEHLGDGTPLREVVGLLTGAPLAAVGVNCVPPALVLPALDALHGTGLPLVAYPNAGETWDAETRRWVGQGMGETLGGAVNAWRSRGARVVGGCCRTTPATIRGMRAAIDAASGP